MCGRFALTAPASTIAEIFQVDVLPDVLPRYNIAPTSEVLCVVQQPATAPTPSGEGAQDAVPGSAGPPAAPAAASTEAGRALQSFRWGLIPFWAKDRKIAYQTLNARSETIRSKPAFRAAFKRRRLLIVTDGFYEWLRKDPKNKVPHLFQMADGKPFAIAGVWERWIDPADGTEVRSCSIVTTSANTLMEPVHDRMPVILPPETWDRWLDPANDDTAALSELLVPFDPDKMKVRRVSKRVGDVKNKDPEVQGPYEEEEAVSEAKAAEGEGTPKARKPRARKAKATEATDATAPAPTGDGEAA